METIEKKVIISIYSRKYNCDELKEADKVPAFLLDTLKPTDRFEAETEGILRSLGKRTSLIYNEDEKSGTSGTRTIISFTEDEREKIKIMRCGTVRSTLDIEIGRQTESKYTTSFFNFTLNITGYSCQNKLTSSGGELKLDYLMNIPYTLKERTLISISAKLSSDDE